MSVASRRVFPMTAFRFLRLERELQFAFVADDAGGKEAHQGPNAGWVYVLYQTQDPNFENRYHKVGLTTNDPDYRADELWATAVPLPMNVRYALFSDDIHKLEADFYQLTDGIRLKYPRLPGARQPIKPREFVPLSLSEAVRVLNDCAGVDDHYCGLHLVAPDAVDRVRRALGSSFRPTGLTSAVFAAAPPCDAIAVLGQTQQKRIRDMEARAFSAARETLLRVGGIAGLITIGGAAVGTILGSPLDHSVTMGAAGLAGSAALGVLAALMRWRSATALTSADLMRFGRAARDLIEAPPVRGRRGPLVIACTGVAAKPSLIRAPTLQRAVGRTRRRRQSLRLVARRARLRSAG